jgi:hypothetical protein
MKRISYFVMLMICMAALWSVVAAQDDELKSVENNQESDSTALEKSDVSGEVVFATYFHGTHRCATCRKLEAYAEEALLTAFEKELEDSTIIWRTINYDEKENEHYLKDYDLYTKALILSRVENGTEVEWKNLPKIWDLVGDKDKFLKYVQDETGAFLGEASD